MPADGRRQAMQLLMSWTAQNIANSSEHVNMLRSKLAQTLVWLFIQEFPQVRGGEACIDKESPP